jgi:hypothetical protein
MGHKRWQCLVGYYKGTGQQNKFSILFNSKRSLDVMETIMESLPIHNITFEAKYLGLPMPEWRLKVDKFQAISERMTKRCNA